jgi:hypothetical protein
MTSKLRFLFDVYLQANGVWQFKQFCGSLVQMMCGRRGARLDDHARLQVEPWTVGRQCVRRVHAAGSEDTDVSPQKLERSQHDPCTTFRKNPLSHKVDICAAQREVG